MRTLTKVLIFGLAILLLGCEERTEETDSGGVLLEVDFVNTVLRAGVEENEILAIPLIQVRSVIPDQTSGTSSLMDVNVETIEVVFSRADTGTRVPPPYFLNIIGTVPVGGTLSLNNFPVMSSEQTRVPPLSDLLLVNGGFDKETGLTFIRLNMTIRVFGRTLSGTGVASIPRTQTIEFVPSVLFF